jgi:hypothetical protein
VSESGRFRLAQPGDTPDGIVTSVKDGDRFTVETAGEAELKFAGLAAGSGYGVGADGVLVSGSYAKATSDKTLLLPGGSGGGGGGGGGGPITVTTDQVTDMSPWGRAWVKLPDDDSAKSQLDILNFNANIPSYSVTINATPSAARIYTLPDQSGTFALLEREQTFSARQHISGVTPVLVTPGFASVGGGSVWASHRVEVGTYDTAEASQFGGTADAVDVLPDAGKVRIGGGWVGCEQGVTVSAGRAITDPFGGPLKRTSLLFQPKTAWDSSGLNFTWCNPPAPYGDGKLIAHVGVNGSAMDFSIDGLSGGCQFYTNTGPTTAQSCLHLGNRITMQCTGYSPASPASNTISVAGGSLDAYNWLACGSYLNVGGHGAPSSPYYADFHHASRWARFRGLVPSSVPTPPETFIGGGIVHTADRFIAESLLESGYYGILSTSSLQLAGQGKTLTLHGANQALTFNGGDFTFQTWTADTDFILNPTRNTLLRGAAPSSVASGEVKIGGGNIKAYAGFQCYTAGSDTVGAASYVAFNDPANERGAIWQLGASRSLDLWMHDDTNWYRTMRVAKDGITTFTGTAPSSVGTGEVKIGGAKVMLPNTSDDSSIRCGCLEVQSYAINNAWIADNLYYYGGWKYRSNGVARMVRLGDGSGNFMIGRCVSGLAGASATPLYDFTIDTSGTSVFNGTAPATPGANEVKIGGGAVRARGALYSDDGTVVSTLLSAGTFAIGGTATNHPFYLRSNNTNAIGIDTSQTSTFYGTAPSTIGTG